MSTPPSLSTPVLYDRYGLSLSTRSLEAAEAYQRGIDTILSAGAGAAEHFLQAVTADPEFALAQAALAAATAGRTEAQEARVRAEQALSLAQHSDVTPRERRHVQALAARVAGDVTGALALIREQLAEYPRDAFLLFLAAGMLRFGATPLGGPDPRRACLDLYQPFEPHYERDWWFNAGYSMVLTEVGQVDLGRARAEQSLALNSQTYQGAHCFAHALYEGGEYDTGAQFLADWLRERPEERGAIWFGHDWWHLTIFELAQGHWQRALALYQQHVAPPATRAQTTIMDAAGLLWRGLVYGYAVPEHLWQDARQYAIDDSANASRAMYGAHAALAFAAARDWDALERLCAGLDAADAYAIGRHVVLPIARAARSFVTGDHAQTARHLAPVADQLVYIGGSNLQRSIFEDTLIEAALRSGDYGLAATRLQVRLGRRQNARDLYWLGRAQLGLGQRREAVQSLTAAQRTWSEYCADTGSPEVSTLHHLLASN